MLAAHLPSALMSAPLYRTIDIHLAAFLCCEGARLHSYRKVRPKRTEFRFVADAALHRLLRVYWSQEPLLIVPHRLLSALFRLKCMAIALGRQHEQYGAPASGTHDTPSPDNFAAGVERQLGGAASASPGDSSESPETTNSCRPKL